MKFNHVDEIPKKAFKPRKYADLYEKIKALDPGQVLEIDPEPDPPAVIYVAVLSIKRKIPEIRIKQVDSKIYVTKEN